MLANIIISDNLRKNKRQTPQGQRLKQQSRDWVYLQNIAVLGAHEIANH